MRSTFAVVLVLASSSLAQHDKPKIQAAKLFASRCASCHTVPDPRVATDLAWLDQVKRTT